jgi:CRISPR-associated protein Cas5d
MNGHVPLELRVWGDLACFTRPDMKVERVSYPCMTPSAARGVLEAIFWKPQMRWRVREIWVLKPIEYLSMVRNEVNSKASARAAQAWGPRDGYFAEEDRAQRHTLALRCVDYLIRADVEVMPEVGEDPAKYRDQFRRRVAKGACAYSPYLGTRECIGSFGPRRGDEAPIKEDLDLGLMLYDIDYEPGSSGRGTPRFFEARLQGGVLRIPDTPRVLTHAPT